MTETNEFTHIEIKVVRNPKWLQQGWKQGFYLSEEFPLGDFELPEGYGDVTEADIDNLRVSIRTLVVLKPLQLSETEGRGATEK